jgi:hypothetical protein
MAQNPFRTIGQLRQQIAHDGHAWQPDPGLPDNTPLRSYPTGCDGAPAGRIATPDPDVRALAARKTANASLAARRISVLSGLRRTQDAPAPAPSAPPPVVDWRNRFAGNWLCSVQDQTPCGNCWAFATAALVESMVRIEHSAWSKRSEGDLRDGSAAGTPFASTLCSNPWNVEAALSWIQSNNGIADPACWPFTGSVVKVYSPTPDRSARTVLIGETQSLTAIAAQKSWLDLVGPIAAFIIAYPSFQNYSSGVWQQLSIDTVPPGANYNHQVLVVGYDDNQGAWIVRNSYGSGWGDGGYGFVGYGQGAIDGNPKSGLSDITPDPWTRRRLQNGCFIEGGNGSGHKNFEALLTTLDKPAHVWREDGTNGDFSWYLAPAALLTATQPGDCIGSPALICTTFGRNFEAVYRSLVAAGQPGNLRHRFLDQTTQEWTDGGTFGPPDVDGYPGFIQSSFGAPGNFEVVVRTAEGRLAHWWRMDGPPWTWQEGSRFGANILQSGPSLIQSSYGTNYEPGGYPVAGLLPGSLECVAVLSNGKMQHYQLDYSKKPATWAALETFGSDIGNTPVCMIEGNFGTKDETSHGNFELCVATPSGGIQHWWRNNGGDQTWQMSATFGSGVRDVVGMIQSSWGNLEILAFMDPGYAHFLRDAAGWHQSPGLITPIVLSV